MKKIFVLLVFLLAGIWQQVRAAGHSDVILGAKVYKPVREPKDLVGLAKSLGLNTLFVGDELAGSIVFREECRRAELKYFLIIRTFNDSEAADGDPTLVSVDRDGHEGRREGDVMISPSRADFRQAKKQQIRAAIERMKPDGVTLDYFRYFIYWEAVDPKTGPVDFPAFSFDRASVEQFLQSRAIRLKTPYVPGPGIVPQAVRDEIWTTYRDLWYEWRVEQITANAKELTSYIRREFPGIPIVLHAVPWNRGEFSGARERIVGQDLRLLARYFDYVSPMAYSALTRRGPGWIGKLNAELLTEVPREKLLPSIEVGPDGPEFPPMSREHFESDLAAARRAPAGVVLYHLELLLDAPEKQEITRRLMTSSE